MTITKREKTQVKCPKCNGTKVVRQLSGFIGQTAKRS
jgi:ssDNA-binding Zn-finger/Zn-ribbon topoisomerase 1